MLGSQNRREYGALLSVSRSTEKPDSPQTTAGLWFQDPIQTIAARATGNFSPTADGACPIEFGDNRSAFVKPRTENKILVAQEKIAADLGYLLGLPVAPIVILNPDPSNNWPHHTAMSLVVNKSARLWVAGGDVHMPIAAEPLERLRVFWTWIGDCDHNNHGANLLFAVSEGKIELCAIDHGHSLSRYCHPDPLAVPASSGYGTGGLLHHKSWAQSEIAKIMSLDWGSVENVVYRLHAILTKEEQERILNILKKRRDHLATFLGL
jgi:hypothetical protein